MLFKHGTTTVKALISEIRTRLDLSTLNADNSDQLELNDIGTATIKLAAALPVDDYTASKRTGASLLIDPADGNTLAAGLIILPEAPKSRVLTLRRTGCPPSQHPAHHVRTKDRIPDDRDHLRPPA